MEWSSNQVPTLRELVAYAVARARDRGATLNRTKLVKLLYLIDVESVASNGRTLSGLDWVFFHYGPFAHALNSELEHMEGAEIATRRYGDAILYVGAPGAPDSQWWRPAVTMRVDRIVDRWVGEPLNAVLDHVYFHTEPMRHAVRGQPLDMGLARSRPRRQVALPPPEAPADVGERLAAWRERRRRALETPPDDAPREMCDLPEAPSLPDGAHGRVSVGSDDEFGRGD